MKHLLLILVGLIWLSGKAEATTNSYSLWTTNSIKLQVRLSVSPSQFDTNAYPLTITNLAPSVIGLSLTNGNVNVGTITISNQVILGTNIAMTTNLNVLMAGGTTNQLQILNGSIIKVIPQ